MSPGIQMERQGTCATTGSRLEIVNPLKRADWDALVATHSRSTVFHGSGWARVLAESYGHVPVYICRFDEGRLVEALPLMEVSSWWKGRRGVSLPFTDSCGPICEPNADGRELYQEAVNCGRQRRWKYLECRNFDPAWDRAKPSLEFYGHVIDLGVGADRLFKGMDSSIRRGVRKAEAAGLKVEFHSDAESMRVYYELHCQTRRRHGLPPQPFRFFENIQRHMMGPGKGFVAISKFEGQPASAAVFSNFAMQQHRPNNLMMWESMRRCAEEGSTSLNLGRSSLSNDGLRRFKLGLGGVEQKLQYAKYDFVSKQFVADVDRVEGWFNRVFSRMPLPMLRLAGASLYPHLS
jgi:hypothetical protein